MLRSRISKLLPGLLLLGIPLLYWSSSLVFFPVPWPDDSAFYLPGKDWVSPEPRYLMRTQAAFVPSYDQANFNTMPTLPTAVGIARLIGFDGIFSIRIFGFLGLGLVAWGLFFWMTRQGLHRGVALVIALQVVASPVLRWGSALVRPEIWQGLIWIALLLHFQKRQSPSLWVVSGWLALAASIHFQAVFWVPGVAVGLFPWGTSASLGQRLRTWGVRLIGVIWRVLVLLSPWLLYVALNWGLFWEQMGIQFGRLAFGNPYAQDLYGLFHSLFLSAGNPVDYPKHLNIYKFVFWGSMLSSAGFLALRVRPVKAEVAMVLTSSLVMLGLWLKKPEVWFITLVHVAFWSMFAMASVHARRKWIPVAACGVLLFFASATTLTQHLQSREHYTRQNYLNWVDCIEEELGPRTQIWQPGLPDVLVELSERIPDAHLTRYNDFPNTRPLAEALMDRSEAVIHTIHWMERYRYILGETSDYRGPSRPEDLRFFEVLDMPWLLASRDRKNWDYRICQIGPFWAMLMLQKTDASHHH